MFTDGVALLSAGESQSALQEFERSLAEASGAQKADSLYNIAVCHVRLGNTDKALQAITDALAVDASLAREFAEDKDFAPLAADVRFKAVLGVTIQGKKEEVPVELKQMVRFTPGLFDPQHYWPFVVGAFLFGSPLYGLALKLFGPEQAQELPYWQDVLIASGFAFLFVNAHSVYGHFSWRVFIVLTVVLPLALVFIARIPALILTGGFVGFIAMYAGGFLGLALGRRFPILPAPSIVRKSDERLISEGAGWLRIGPGLAREQYAALAVEASRRGFDLNERTRPLLEQEPAIDDPTHYYIRPSQGAAASGPWSVSEIRQRVRAGEITGDWLALLESQYSGDTTGPGGWQPVSLLPFVASTKGHDWA